MGSACGVSWDGTSSGKLDESAIPDPPDHKSHYLNAAETKGDSSFPVVDGDGNLRAGNVNSAWDLRNQGDGVGEDCLRKLDNAFDEDVLPDSAYDNMDTIAIAGDDVDGEFGINFEFNRPRQDLLGDGFNEWGVREREDGSVDVRFEAMEPGEWKGAEITPDFLENVVSHDYDRIPIQLDHSQSQRANVGFVKPSNIGFNESVFLQGHVPNTGSTIRDDVIADFTHEPPQIQDISMSFDPRTLEVERPQKRGDPVKFVDGRIREVSLTPFPAGYDNGGLTPEFSSAVERVKLNYAEDSGEDDPEPESQLVTRPHILIKH